MIENSLSIIVPVYNEEKIIETSLVKLDSYLKSNFQDYEILVIESGSTDRTFEILDTLGKKVRLRIIQEGKKLGFGSGLRLGYKNALKNYVTLVTVDFPFSLEYLKIGMEMISDYDCILSYRSSDNRSILRRFQSLVYNILVKNVLSLKVKNINSAFKLFKRTIVQSLPLSENGWLIDAEIIYYIQKFDYKYLEIGVPLEEDKNRNSSTSLFSFYGVLKDLIRFKKLRS